MFTQNQQKTPTQVGEIHPDAWVDATNTQIPPVDFQGCQQPVAEGFQHLESSPGVKTTISPGAFAAELVDLL
jgi:hypothetical protein